MQSIRRARDHLLFFVMYIERLRFVSSRLAEQFYST